MQHKTRIQNYWKNRCSIPSPKDPIPTLKTPGIYEIPCSCGKVFVGQTRSAATRLEEDDRRIRLKQPMKSAVPEHAISRNHTIKFESTKFIAASKFLYPKLYRAAIEIKKHTVKVHG